MTVQECHVGMVTSLPMEYAISEGKEHKRPMARATCIWIHSKGRYAVFQFDNGFKETVYLDDEKRWAKNAVIPVATVPPELLQPNQPLTDNNAKVAEAVKTAHVSKLAVSRMAGKSDAYLSMRLREYRMDDEETAYWLDMIHDTAAEKRKVVLPDADDPFYTLKAMLAENHLSRSAASRLLGHRDNWLSDQMRRPLSIGRQRAIAESIMERLSNRSESAQSDSTD